MHRSISVLAAVACVALLGCSESETDSDDMAAAVSLFDGSWVGPCIVSDDGVDAIQESAVINGSSGSLSIDQHTDTACTMPAQRFTFGVDIDYGDEVFLAETGIAAQALDLIPTQIVVTPLSQFGVAGFNQSMVCGASGFELGVSVELPFSCPQLSAFTRAQFQLAAVVNGVLFLGDEAGATAESRPAGLNLDKPYVRVSGAF